MGKSLVIVESPAKAKTINKYLGKDFIVKSSIGHIRDLPVSRGGKRAEPNKDKSISKEEKKRLAMVNRMGIDPSKSWKANYQILPGKEKVVAELKKIAKNADNIYLATDLDREGEAIAWHLKEVIGGDEDKFKRVVFNEITKTAIQEAFAKPGELDLNQVNAQQTRRFLDRVVGFELSPLLWKKVARGLSAGRVQSVAVRLLVEREREIRAFIPDEFWQLHADLTTDKSPEPLRFETVKRDGKKYYPRDKAESDESVTLLKKAEFKVSEREERKTSSKPSAPFITSTLQQTASTRLGYGVKRTMILAQRLYEAGHITYMRTDSTNLSDDALSMVRAHIVDAYGQDYLPAQAISYSSKKGAQEAHEAIRPTNLATQPGDIDGLDVDARKLYDLIWRRFVACQMMPAKYLSTNLIIDTQGHELRLRGRIMQFAGYTKVYAAQVKDDANKELPDVKKGDILQLAELLPTQHFTKPPARFTEASLVRELEKQGIGRPSTYASIISTIQDRGYAKVENRRFYAEKIGDIVTTRLVENFGELLDFQFTAQMEAKLDEIADGKKKWKTVLNAFYKDFQKQLAAADGGEDAEGMRANDPIEVDISCKACQRPMMVRAGSTGVFLGCSGYSLKPKERCKETMNLVNGDEAVDENDAEGEARIQREKHRCPKCHTAMDSYLVDEKRKLHICGNYPDCDGSEIEAGEFKIKGYEGPVLECDKCGDEMQLKSGRFGKYFGCMATECKNTRKLLRNGQPAPPKADPIPMPELQCEKVDDFYLLRDGASGLFLAASKFPRNRETRAPRVKELLTVKDQLDPKFKYLTKAPTEDDDGIDTFIRYSRKTKEQYVRSEKDGKQTKWSSWYKGGKWVTKE